MADKQQWYEEFRAKLLRRLRPPWVFVDLRGLSADERKAAIDAARATEPEQLVTIDEDVVDVEYSKAAPPVVPVPAPAAPGVVDRVVGAVRRALTSPPADPNGERDSYREQLKNLSVDDLNGRVRSPLTPQQRNAVDDELNRRQRVRRQDEPASGPHDAALLEKDDGRPSRWDEGSLLSSWERLH